ncbi:MAG: isopenicillin N synthase-like dioxygenase [Gammaproteobacteria bacterium]|jgi:isopenicillin N synthase-like dioxygenase
MADHLVPTIDISAPTDSMLSELDQACIDYGFFLLSGHGLDELIERTWAVTEQFFAGHRASKLAVIRDADTLHDTLGEFYDSCSDLAVRANELGTVPWDSRRLARLTRPPASAVACRVLCG